MNNLMELAEGQQTKPKVLLTREERLRKVFRDSTDSPDLRILKSQSRFVAGGGSLEPKVVFVGDVPGLDESRSGQPLMGRRLHFVLNLLKGVDLKQGDMYVTHLLKYRTPNGRDAKELEVEASIECLKREIEILKPSIVVTWGRQIIDVLSPGFTLQHNHGELIPSVHGFNIVPMFSPDAALVNPHVTELLIKDFQIIRDLV